LFTIGSMLQVNAREGVNPNVIRLKLFVEQLWLWLRKSQEGLKTASPVTWKA